MDAEISASSRARAQLEGTFARHIALARLPLSTIIKTAATLSARHAISAIELREMLLRIYGDSVEPFLGPSWGWGADRLGRFGKLRQGLTEARLI